MRNTSAYFVLFTDAQGRTVDGGIFSVPYPRMGKHQLALGAVRTLLLDQEDPMQAGTKGAWMALINRIVKNYGAAVTLPTLAGQLYRLTIADAQKRANFATAGYAYASHLQPSPRGPLGLRQSMVTAGCPNCGSASASTGGCNSCGGSKNAILLAALARQNPYVNPYSALYPAQAKTGSCGRAGCTGTSANCPCKARSGGYGY